VIVPNKETIYADMLPDDLGRKRGRSTLDALSSMCGGEIVDLRGRMLEARHEHAIYYREGTHWTSQGAYAGYEGVLAALAKSGLGITPIPRSAFDLRPEQNLDSWVPEKDRSPVESSDGLYPTVSYPSCYQAENRCVPLLFPDWQPIPVEAWNTKNQRRIV